jgi:hypothetical protein
MLQVVFRCVWLYSLCVLALANHQFLHPYRVLLGVGNILHQESIYSGAPDKESVYSGAPDNIRNRNTDSRPRYKQKPLKSSLQNPFKARLELHPPRQCANSCNIYPIIELQLFIYFLILHSLPHSPTLDLRYSKWNLRPARWGITIHRRIKKHT